MDPNIALRLINDHVVGFDQNPEEARTAKRVAEDLRIWIAEGGCPGPKWEQYPKATAFYSNHIIEYWKGKQND